MNRMHWAVLSFVVIGQTALAQIETMPSGDSTEKKESTGQAIAPMATPTPISTATPAPTAASTPTPPSPSQEPTPPYRPAVAPAEPSVQPVVPGAKHRREWKFAGAIGFNSGGSLSFPNATINDGFGDINSTQSFTVTPSVILKAEAGYMGEHSWGFNFGVSVDSKKNLNNSQTYDQNTSGIGGSTELSMQTIYANALYEWRGWYLPFGINVTHATVDNAAIAMQDLKAGPGMQFGVGYFFNPHFSLEFVNRVVTFSAGSQTAAGETTDLKTGVLTESQFLAKGYF